MITVIIGNNSHYLKSNNNEFLPEWFYRRPLCEINRFGARTCIIHTVKMGKRIISSMVQLNENYHRINVNCSHNTELSVFVSVCVQCICVYLPVMKDKEQIQASPCISIKRVQQKNWPFNRIICAFCISIAIFYGFFFSLFAISNSVKSICAHFVESITTAINSNW